MEKPVESQPTEIHDKLPLTYDNLYEFWGEFAKKRKIERDSVTEELIFNRDFKLEGQTIRIALDNELQREAMTAIRNELIQFLRERLDAPALAIDFPVNLQETKKVAYTDKEKFAVMAEKNPHLLELQQLLGLDIEF